MSVIADHRGQLSPRERRAALTETWLVLGVSLGASAVWALLSLVRKLTAGPPLSSQTTAMNTTVVPDRPWLDLLYQLAGIGLGVVPALLAVFLLGRAVPRARALIGLDRSRPAGDLLGGVVLAAAVGVPGLGLYLLAREIGLNTTISAAGLPEIWWAVPVLVLAAVQNAVLEEVVMVGYLFTRWAQAGWSTVTIVLTSALVRGAYHLYQGFGGFVGNLAMGALFGWYFTRTRRVLPLVVAHTLLDVVAFVGYALVAPHVDWL